MQDEAAFRAVCRALYLLVRPDAGQGAGQLKLFGSSVQLADLAVAGDNGVGSADSISSRPCNYTEYRAAAGPAERPRVANGIQVSYRSDMDKLLLI